MIEVNSDLEIPDAPFDVRCTLLHTLYSKHPCHGADAAASLCHTAGLKTKEEDLPSATGLYNKGSWQFIALGEPLEGMLRPLKPDTTAPAFF